MIDEKLKAAFPLCRTFQRFSKLIFWFMEKKTKLTENLKKNDIHRNRNHILKISFNYF